MRRNLVLEETRFPSELTKVFNSLERNNNPFGLRARTRADWAKGLGLKILSEHPTSRSMSSIGSAATARSTSEPEGREVARAHPPGRRDQFRHPRHGGELHGIPRAVPATNTSTRCWRRATSRPCRAMA